jgi:hypothetical protein
MNSLTLECHFAVRKNQAEVPVEFCFVGGLTLLGLVSAIESTVNSGNHSRHLACVSVERRRPGGTGTTTGGSPVNGNLATMVASPPSKARGVQ